MVAPFRLRSGDVGPVQQSPVSCGSACLTVARMLVNPGFAHWMVTGEGPHHGVPDGADELERFAAYERVVMARTNRLLPGGRRLNLPWPRAFGTPPWGALQELEYGASRRGTDYRLQVVRSHTRSALGEAYDQLVTVVADGEPALLYVGHALLPRHVTLVLPGDGDRVLDVYDPSSGRVSQLDEESFVGRRLALSGWDVPWLTVQPTGARRVQAGFFSTGIRSTSRTPRVSASA